MFNKNSLFFFILLFPYFASSEEPKTSNYKKYKDTASQFRLEQLNVTLEHPWAISFIKEQQLSIRSLTSHTNQGVRKEVCSMCTITLWTTISILPTAMMSMEPIPVQPLLGGSWGMMRL